MTSGFWSASPADTQFDPNPVTSRSTILTDEKPCPGEILEKCIERYQHAQACSHVLLAVCLWDVIGATSLVSLASSLAIASIHAVGTRDHKSRILISVKVWSNEGK